MKNDQDRSSEDELGDLLGSALLLKNDNPYPKGGGLFTVARLEDFFTTRLKYLLLDKNIIEQEMFLCADYIGRFLPGYARGLPSQAISSLNGKKRDVLIRPFEYLLAYWQQSQAERSGEDFPNDKTENLSRGGQICFVISVFFPLLQRRHRVGERHYAEMGAALFYQYWLDTGKKVAHHMAERFEDLVPLTQEAIED